MRLFGINLSQPEVVQAAPFETYFGTSVPSNEVGVNGDLFIRYGNTVETIYKKVENAWVNTSSAKTTADTILTITDIEVKTYTLPFALSLTDRLSVHHFGLRLYEGADEHFVRNVTTSQITLHADLVITVGDKLLIELN